MTSAREFHRPPGNDPTIVEGYIVRLHGPAWGLAMGLLLGIALLLATIILVLKGGEQVGPHLALLEQYLPFYSVTLAGSLVGLVDGFILGYTAGRLICVVYNRAARL